MPIYYYIYVYIYIYIYNYLLLTLKFIKCLQYTSNTVFKSLVGIYMQSSEFGVLLKSRNLSMIDVVHLPVYALKGFITDLFRAKNDLSL